jgi:HCOMODA/2-hydroxy-3-carboxy-muconic semialdehyde decarboxylase
MSDDSVVSRQDRGAGAAQSRDEATRDLVAANRILANQGVVDGYGHLSIRHPERSDRFLMSCSRSPALVSVGDIVVHDLEGEGSGSPAPLYAERFIHAAIYSARPDINAVVHTHAYELIPYGVSGQPLRPVFHAAARIGQEVPVWDIAEEFGDTNLLVVNMRQGLSLAKTLGRNRVVLMRGHGATNVAGTLRHAVMTAIYAQINARLQHLAMQLGSVKYLSPGELELAGDFERKGTLGLDRNWEYLKHLAGCDDL